MLETAYDSDDACVFCGDCLELLATLPDQSVDMVLTSPPYENARSYGTGFNLKGEEWVKWAFVRYLECVRVCRGLVAWVVEGRTSNFRYTATPLLLAADLHRAGVKLRKPPIYRRVGIPGSGGPDWVRNDYEYVLCSTHGKLPWSDNTAMGAACKFPVGGEMSYRDSDGVRKNTKVQTRRKANGVRARDGLYVQPEVANPGNVIVGDVIDCHGGGGHMGSKLAHENEAPFPETLAEFLIRSFCPPGGLVLDIFGGSGTTLATAIKHGRRACAVDVRMDQCELMVRRIAEARGVEAA